MIKRYVFFLLSIATIYAEIPKFKASDPVKANGKPILCEFACPCVIDWDGDTKRDLLLGEFAPPSRTGSEGSSGGNGKIRYYKNSGTNSNPVFTNFEYLKAGGVEIGVGAG